MKILIAAAGIGAFIGTVGFWLWFAWAVGL